jgi:hypothetical protein
MARGDGFRHLYIDAIRLHILSGQCENNADAARLLGVDETTIVKWRSKYPHFDREFRVAVAEALAGVTSGAFILARQGDGGMIRFILERRGGTAWQARQHIDHTSNGNTMAALIAEHGEMDEYEARERGLIIDDVEYDELDDAGNDEG